MIITEAQLLAAMEALGEYDDATGELSRRIKAQRVIEAVLGPCVFPAHHAQTCTVVGASDTLTPSRARTNRTRG